MKLFRMIVMISCILTTFPAAAQESMMDYVKKLSARYPNAWQRYEIRLTPSKNGSVRKETRYDLRISRSVLTATEQQQLTVLYQREWQKRNSTGDKAMLYVSGDSVSCTIVYGVPQNSDISLDQTFYTRKGFMLYDQSRNGFYVKVSKVEIYAASLLQPDFTAVRQCISRLAESHGATVTDVKYSGANGTFCFQRGSGEGWTTGTRYTIAEPSEGDFDEVRRVFTACATGRNSVELIAYNDNIILHNEAGKEIFMAKTDGKGRLHLLCATEGEEPCVPIDWTTIDFFNNGITEHVDVSRLDSISEALASRPGGVHTAVRYTGGWRDGCAGFEWQRSNGRGWTTGTRIALPYDPETEQTLRDILAYYQGKLPHVNMGDYYAATYEEGTKTFYGYHHERDSLYFLRATTENEICVPFNWPVSSYYEGPHDRDSDGMFGNASPITLRLLGLGRLWAEVKRNFVYYDKIAAKWDSIYVATIPQMQCVANDEEANLLLQKMAAQLHDGHTFVIGLNYGESLPICTRLIDGRVYIDGVYNEKIKEMGLERGMEITKIDGIDVRDYARKYLFPLISSSTPQWTDHEVFDGDMLTTKRGNAISLEAGNGDSIQTYTFYNMSGYRWENYPQRPILDFRVMDGNIGYLKITSFNNSQIREDFDNVFPEILKTKALIIDIRDNGGGNSRNGDYILSHLSNDSICKGDWDSPLYCPALASWSMKMDNYAGENEYVYPIKNKQHYTGAIVTLINRGTFSAAEDFCSSLAWMKRGPIIGQPTGGSTGNGVRVELIPNSSSANICSKHDVGADGSEFVGIGIIPTISVEETADSYFRNPVDNALSEALKFLKAK